VKTMAIHDIHIALARKAGKFDAFIGERSLP
jgi:hypothetical protein